MRYISFIVALFAVSVSAFADESPAIRLPMVPPTPQNDPAPTVPKLVSEIVKGELYVVQSSVELIALQSPEVILNVMSSKGPLSVYGLFSDGSGEPEFRTFTSENLVIVSGIKPGKTELLLVPIGVMESKSIVRQILTVSGEGPRPGPLPPMPPNPPTPVDPIPTPGKIKIVIIEDPSLRASLPMSQLAVMDGITLRQYAKTHCTETNGTTDFRLLSLRQDVSNQPEWIKTAFAEPRSSLPFIVVSNGVTGAAVPLPKTDADTLSLLKKYGGE